MPLPFTVSCFNKIQIGFTYLVPADLGSPGKRAVKRVCVCVCVCVCDQWCLQRILDIHWNDFVRNGRTYSFEHSDNVFGVVEWSDFIVASAVDDSHRLQADAFHSDLRRQQKPMIQIVEELVSGTDQMTIEVCGKLQ